MSRALLLALPVAVAAIPAARAADATPEGAVAAETAVRDFMRLMLGPDARVGDKPVRFQPGGDHYDASATLAPGQQATATVREGAAGTWTFDTLRYPNPAHFTLTLPNPGGTPADTRITYDLKAAEQDGSGSVDTTLATPSASTGTLRALSVTNTSADRSSSTRIGRATSTATLAGGKAPGTVDMSAKSTASDYTIAANAQTKDVAVDLRLDLDGVDTTIAMDGIARDKAPGFTRALTTAIVRSTASGADKPDPEPARALVRSMAGLASGMSLDQGATRLRGTVNKVPFSLEGARVAFDGHSPAGTLDVGMRLEATGLVLPTFASGPFGSFIPSRFVIRPMVSGMDTRDVLESLVAAMDPNRPEGAGPPPAFNDMLSKPGLAGEIDELEIDIGPTRLTGKGKVGAPTPGRFGGAGTIAVANFDALTDRVKAVPEAAQALPALLFIKGIGRTDGDRVVWDITYDGQTVLVNGVDVMAMAGGGGRPAPAPGGNAPPTRRR